MGDMTTEVKSEGVDVRILLEKIKGLQSGREMALQARDSVILANQKLEKKIRDFLKSWGTDETFIPFGVENLDGLVDCLLLVIRAQIHDIECRQRAQNRAEGIIEYVQSESWDLEKDKGSLVKRITMLELELETLKEGNKKDARKKR